MPTVVLRTLGGVELVDDAGRELRQIVRRPKQLALVVYLALARPRGFHRRDSLIALLWPELDQEHARAGLRKTLVVLRQELGEEAVIRRGDDELRIPDEVVWCDAVAFERALDAGALADGLALYRGDLLPGFHVGDASAGLSQWLEEERGRLRARAASAAWRLSEQRGEEGDVTGSREWAYRAAQLEPLDEGSARRLINALDRLGDRAAAIRAYETFTRRLRDELDLEPSEDTVALARSLRDRALPTEEDTTSVRVAPVGNVAATVFSSASSAPQVEVPRQRRRRPWRTLTAVMVSAVAAVVLLRIPKSIGFGPAPGAASDPALVAVFPFRVAGGDSTIASLREGMVDLLAARLDGEVGPRAVEPRTALAAWRSAARQPDADLPLDVALRVAARLGAGRVVLGEIVGTTKRLTATATLLDGRERARLARASVDGSADSLPVLVDRLVVQLLSLEHGEPAQRMSHLTSASPRALNEFLLGRQAYRGGRVQEAATRYSAALELDTIFALAALELLQVSRWYQAASPPQVERARAVAWAGRERMGLRDRMMLRLALGDRYPQPPTRAEELALRERAVEMFPDHAEFWHDLGGMLVTWGDMLGIDRALERATAALDRGLALDSSFVPLHYNRLRAALLQRDASARTHAAHILALDPDFEGAGALRWWLALDRGDNTALRAIRQRLDTLSGVDLARIHLYSVELGLGMDDAARAADLLVQRSVTPDERGWATWRLYFHFLFRGRPSDASRVRERLTVPQQLRHARQTVAVAANLVSVGDPDDAAASIRILAAHAAAPAARTRLERIDQLNDVCWVGRWRLHQGDTAGAARYARQLREAVAREQFPRAGPVGACSLEIDAALAHLQRRGDADRQLAALDSVMRTPTQSIIEGNLAVARLKEARGDIAGALAVVRRRSHFWNSTYFLDASLREEARLATMLGDRAGAIRAYQHYLALRSDPEPSVVPEVRRARRTLDSLLRSGPR